MAFEIIYGDITKMEADAIVNAANPGLKMGGGVCGAIFAAAGADELQRECDAIGGCETGEAVITNAFGLRAKYIIHVVGPVWQGGANKEKELLKSCYRKALSLAAEHKCESVAFPLISSGIYGYPRELALKEAKEEISAFLEDEDMEVFLVLYDAN